MRLSRFAARPQALHVKSSGVRDLETVSGERRGVAAIYDDKPAAYFGNARRDIVELLATGPGSSILELGCGAGGTGEAALKAGKAGFYVGIELSETAAAVARDRLTQVIVGNVEEIDLRDFAGRFDALIVSEVLEHLTDPWTTLRRLVECLKPGAVVVASSPNVAHWKVVSGLLRGRFSYADAGVMDRTHLRWFTPSSYQEMFEQAGVQVIELRPLRKPGLKARLINGITAGRLWHLFTTQVMVVGRRRPAS